MDIFPRISGRTGSPIDLNITFYQNGVPTDPWAITKVSIYKQSVQAENLVAEIPILPNCDPDYPFPLTREPVDPAPVTGPCGTDPSLISAYKPGIFHLIWDVPVDISVPDIFFDVWSFIPTNPGVIESSGGCSTDQLAVLADETLWQSCCNEFWLYPDSSYCDSGLETIRFMFEALDVKFQRPEVRTLEVGIMPGPLYDFDYNKVAPIMPYLTATISLSTFDNDLLIDEDSMKIGLRQGTYRTNPFVLQYKLDTSCLLKGSYKYRVKVLLPNGESRVSQDFVLQVS